MDTAKITSKGQVTIPKAVRSRMAVEAGDRLAFEFDREGTVRMRPLRREHQPLLGFLAQFAASERLSKNGVRQALRARAATKHGRP